MAAAPTPEQLTHAVRWAYRLVLGREPEDASVIGHWAGFGDPREVLRAMLRTDEALLRLDRGSPNLGDWAEAAVTREDAESLHLLRHGRLPEPGEELGLPLPGTAGALRRQVLESPEMQAELAALGLGEGESEVGIAGRRFRLHGRRHDDYWAAASRGVTDPGIERLARTLRAALPDEGEGCVLVDAGANIGVSALAMAAAAPRHARLLAIEPDPRNLPILRRNLTANGLDRATVHDCALGAARARLVFRMAARNAAVGHLAPPGPDGAPPKGPRVRVERLDMLLRRERLRRLDVLKLDVEGGEEAALEGAGEVLRASRSLVYAEFNLWTILALADRNPRHLLESWAGRVPHLVGFRPDGAPWPLPTPEDRLAFLHSVIVERQGITDLVLCHDPGWLARWG